MSLSANPVIQPARMSVPGPVLVKPTEPETIPLIVTVLPEAT